MALYHKCFVGSKSGMLSRLHLCQGCERAKGGWPTGQLEPLFPAPENIFAHNQAPPKTSTPAQVGWGRKNCQVRTWSCPTHSQRPSKTSQGLCFPMKWLRRGSSPNQHCIKVRRQKVEGLALGKWVQDEVAGRTESVSRDDILSVQSSPCTCTSFLALYLWYSVLKACKPWWHTQSIRHRSQSTMYIPDTSSAFNVLLHPWYNGTVQKY